jgi:hypothetical protein
MTVNLLQEKLGIQEDRNTLLQLVQNKLIPDKMCALFKVYANANPSSQMVFAAMDALITLFGETINMYELNVIPPLEKDNDKFVLATGLNLAVIGARHKMNWAYYFDKLPGGSDFLNLYFLSNDLAVSPASPYFVAILNALFENDQQFNEQRFKWPSKLKKAATKPNLNIESPKNKILNKI